MEADEFWLMTAWTWQMALKRYRLLVVGISLAAFGFVGAWGTAGYAWVSHARGLTRFKAPGSKDVYLHKGVYFFNYEFETYFEGRHYRTPLSLIDQYDINLFNDAGDELQGKVLAGNSFNMEKTWKYNRQAISVYEFDIARPGMYRLVVASKSETVPEVICSIHKQINLLAILLVAYSVIVIIFLGAVLSLIWLIQALSSCKVRKGD